MSSFQAQQYVYPSPGENIPWPNSSSPTFLSTAGALANSDEYVMGLLLTGRLTTRNPYDTSAIELAAGQNIILTSNLGLYGNGSTDNAGLLTTAISAVPTVGSTLLFDASGTFAVGTNISFPSNLTVAFRQGAVLKPSANVTCSFYGPIVAGEHQIFDVLSSGSVRLFRNDANMWWWGCRDDGVTDNAPMFNAMLASMHRKGGGGAGEYGAVTIDVPVARYGWYMGSSILIPGGNRTQFTLKGHGWFTDSTSFYGPGVQGNCSGSVFRFAPNCDGVKARPGDVYFYARLEDLALVGPGTGAQQKGVNAHDSVSNFQFTSTNLFTGCWATGTYLGNSITGHAHYSHRIRSCLVGLQCGDTTTGPTDTEFVALGIEGCTTGTFIANAYNIRFENGLIQGDTLGILMGLSGTGHDNIHWRGFHLEGNGRDYEFAGGCTSVGSTFTNMRSGGTSPYTIFPSGSAWSGCTSGGARADVPAGQAIWIDGRSDPKGGFASITINQNSRFGRTSIEYPLAGGAWGGGTYTHDWGNTGDNLSLYLQGNTTLAITNAPIGAICTIFLEQDNIGSRTMSFAANHFSGTYTNTGNSAFKRTAMIMRCYAQNIWYTVSAQPWQ